MRITIAEQLKPFSHCPGTRVILPGTTHIVTVYPTHVETVDGKVALDIKGPVPRLTVQVDLERGGVCVWSERRFRYRILPDLSIDWGKGCSTSLPNTPRLSLGSHKKQDWDLITRRGDLKEILPHWFRLGMLLPVQRDEGESLLTRCRETLAHGDFLALFQAGFDGILAPQGEDTSHRGFSLPPVSGDPMAILSEGARLIGSLFIQAEQEKIQLLPALPPDLPCGRLLDFSVGVGSLSIEWTKKKMRCALLKVTRSGEVTLGLRHLKSFRIRRSGKDRGTRLDGGTPFPVSQGDTILIDQFMG